MAIMNAQPMSTDANNPKLADKMVASASEKMEIDGDGVDLPVLDKEAVKTNGSSTEADAKPTDGNQPSSSPTDPPLTANTQEFSGLHITSPGPHVSMHHSIDGDLSPTDTSGLHKDVVVKDEKAKAGTENLSPAATNGVGRRQDEDMPDAPSQKVSRGREDDEMLEPPPKRAKTEDSQDERDSRTDAGTSTGAGLPKQQTKYALAIIKNLRRSKDASPFIYPVDPVALNIPSYPAIIKRPMDLSTMEKKLHNNRYSKVEQFVDDFNLIINNCITFNGPEHPIAGLARNIQTIFERQYKSMPAANEAEPPTPEKKSHKKKASVTQKPPPPPPAPAPKKEAPRPSSSVKPSSSSNNNNNNSNKTPAPKTKKKISPSPAPSPTFAIGPSGVPLIRRESHASGDGRPKREIHPPPPRDLPYSDVKPRKKKFAVELKFCDIVLKEMYKKQYSAFAFVFYNPVDPIALNIPEYFKVIKRPMDLSTIGSKLKTNQYNSASEFEQDVRLMLSNCFKFNPSGTPVHEFGQKMEKLFDSKWREKNSYIAQNTQPESKSHSPSPGPEDDEAHSDEEDPEISKLQRQLQEMQEQLKMMKGKKQGKPETPSASKKSSGSKSKPSSSMPVSNKKSGSSSKNNSSGKRERERVLSVDEKYELSERINHLSSSKLKVVTKMIKEGAPKVANADDDDELELDIDELPNSLLVKLFNYVTKNSESSSNAEKSYRSDYHAPAALAEVSPVMQSAPASRPKKNKPMSATEQEAKIASIQKKLASFDNHKPGQAPATGGGYSAASDSESSDDEESGSSEEE